MAKKKEVKVEVAKVEVKEVEKPDAGEPNKWSKEIKVTLEQLSQLEKDCKLVGMYYDKDGSIIARIR